MAWEQYSDGSLVVSGTGAMFDYFVEPVWGRDVKTAVISEGVTSIAMEAFRNCDSLESVAMPSTLMQISCNAFENCASLGSVTIPGSVRTIEQLAFSGCTSLASVEMEEGSLREIDGAAFADCASLAYIRIPGSVEMICDGYYNVDGGEPEGWWDSFRGLTFLGPDGRELSHTASDLAGHVFVGSGDGVLRIADSPAQVVASGSCGANLTWELDADGNLVISGTGDMDFYDMDDPPWTNDVKTAVLGEGLTLVGFNAFYGCTSLESVTLPNSVVTIEEYAFYGCTSLESVVIPNSIDTIGDFAFAGCSSLKAVEIPLSPTHLGSYAFSDCDSLVSVTLPNAMTMIPDNIFNGCGSLTSITIPNSVKWIGTQSFADCTSLAFISIPESVTHISDESLHFNGEEYVTSDSFKNLTFLGFDGRTLSHTASDLAGHVFVGSGDGVLRMAVPAGGSFEADGLVYTVLDPASLTVSLTGHSAEPAGILSVPSSVSYGGLEYSVASVGAKAFYGCSSLTSLDLGAVSKIDMKAFAKCSSLTSVNLGDSLEAIGSYAFYGLSFYDGDVKLSVTPDALRGHSFSGTEGKLYLTS
ncbi:MAG: leucine-rich repeat domain-containing protein [Candidatus Methanomethylophilaceae archaeon]|nr:leucine-rich repeat domain-containing protein [Candidatus Methanomethylophilaceae archaeon]